MKIDEEIIIKDRWVVRFYCGLFYIGFAIFEMDLKKEETNVPISFFIGFNWFVNQFGYWGFTFHFALLRKGLKELEPIGGIYWRIPLYKRKLK